MHHDAGVVVLSQQQQHRRCEGSRSTLTAVVWMKQALPPVRALVPAANNEDKRLRALSTTVPSHRIPTSNFVGILFPSQQSFLCLLHYESLHQAKLEVRLFR